jgi:hypothetical protein
MRGPTYAHPRGVIDIVRSLETIVPPQAVLYFCSRPQRHLDLGSHNSHASMVVRARARVLEDEGKVMLFQYKQDEVYYYYARAVDPAVKKTIAIAASLAPFPSKIPVKKKSPLKMR